MTVKSILMDVLLAVTFTGLTMVTLAADGETASLAYLLVALMTAPIALRQRAPVLTMCAILGAIGAYVLCYDDMRFNTGVGMLVAMFTVATLRPRWAAAVMFTLTAGVTTMVHVRLDPDTALVDTAQVMVIVFGAWALGEGAGGFLLKDGPPGRIISSCAPSRPEPSCSRPPSPTA
ncbi:hypothetical protein [Spongiactinospora sp. TRM90649]|uniref:DUF7134 domain-containing protein n=1 Tax=Spongiactinospora sp. TRM90649 TaxID=3031114 RepID=UPI0023F6399E|nr:hypothetical protein [Spongiactinospora sp. TRM90649]MDF5752953.1 hypothetical protein [Spongiactinospora sp. TRM90649]